MSEAMLQAVDEDWQRALAVVAHPDDMEYGSASAVARWTGQGKEIAYCLVTRGEAGIDGMDPDEARGVRETEQRASCAAVGVDDVTFLGLRDGALEYGLALRGAIARVIREKRPEIVITNSFRLTWPGGITNQADHIATGRATLDAGRDAGNRWIFTEQLTDGLERWDGVRQVWAAGSPEAGHAVDVTESLDAGVASLREHRAYLDGLGSADFDPDAFLRDLAAAAGERLGTRYAATFEVFSLK